jgi:hypothetical protein
MTDIMKALNLKKLIVINKARSNPALRDWRGQFTPEFVARDLREAGNRVF